MNAIEINRIQSGQKTISPRGKNLVSSFSDLLSKEIKFSSPQLSDKKKEWFYSQLCILLSAGVDIKTSLELISDEQKKETEKKLFNEIKENVLSGISLSDALERTEKFSAYEVCSIRIGEESGQLTEVLKEQTLFFSKKIANRRQLMSVISYPSLVFFVACGAVYFMMQFIVPMFADVFKRFGGELPYLTRLIVRISNLVSSYGIYFLLLLLFIVGFFYLQRKKNWLRSASSKAVGKIPVIGGIINKIYMARFCQSMNLLLGARTPIVNALNLVKEMVGYYPIEKSIDTIQGDILKGKSLHEALGKFPVYPSQMISLIKVAEEVNQLDVIFGKLAKQYSDEAEHQTGLIGTLVEPLMILFLGLFVAVILIAMYLPLFKLSTTMTM